MTRTLSLLGIAALLGMASVASAEDKPVDGKEAALAAWKTINGSGPQIDQCTQAYIGEYPATDGSVKLQITVVKNGTVGTAAVNTSLEGARNLRPCLEKVAKNWKFMPLATETEQLALTIPVKKGQKFVLKKPGEKSEPTAPGQEKQEETVFDFLPSTWTESPK
jgi:hypothetical protein